MNFDGRCHARSLHFLVPDILVKGCRCLFHYRCLQLEHPRLHRLRLRHGGSSGPGPWGHSVGFPYIPARLLHSARRWHSTLIGRHVPAHGLVTGWHSALLRHQLPAHELVVHSTRTIPTPDFAVDSLPVTSVGRTIPARSLQFRAILLKDPVCEAPRTLTKNQ